jgi:hypothetical protein
MKPHFGRKLFVYIFHPQIWDTFSPIKQQISIYLVYKILHNYVIYCIFLCGRAKKMDFEVF